MKKILPFLFLFLFALSSVSFANITGGDQLYNYTINGTNYTIHVFTSNGYFNTTEDITDACFMLVAGGGGGGTQAGGGGGAGGLIFNCSQTINEGNYSINIGAGGTGGTATNIAGQTGYNTSAFGYTALGGGGGGSEASPAGKNGGSGGGAAYSNGVGGSGTAGQGYGGGNGKENHPTYRISGGGGGSNQTGLGFGTANKGHGGNGSAYDINGTTQYYAGGGGGGNTGTYGGSYGYGIGGLGGGGNGAISGAGQDATGYGSGGGGGAVSTTGGAGSSGIVIVRYETILPEGDSINATLVAPEDGNLTLNKSFEFEYNITTNDTTNVSLYIDDVLVNWTTAATNSTLTYDTEVSYGNHTWYVYAEKTANSSINDTSEIWDFEVYFNVSLNSPSDEANLSGNNATFSYTTNNLYNITCNLTIDSVLVNTKNSTPNATNYYNQSIDDGTYDWYVSCYAPDNTSYVKTTPTRTFSINYQTLNYSLNLTDEGNVLLRPQSIFYDIDGNLNVLYFKDEGTGKIVIKKIIDNQVNKTYEATLNSTKDYFMVFRNPTNTSLLLFDKDNSTRYYVDLNATNITITSISNDYLPETNAYYDAYTYANTRHIETINHTDDSYYIFVLSDLNGSFSRIMKYNFTDRTISAISNASSSNVSMQTIAKTDDLSEWYYSYPVSNQFRLFYYNGTHETLLWYNATGGNGTEVDKSIITFENYEGATYFGQFNQTNRALIHHVEKNITAYLPYNVSNPSHFYFITNETFVFFSEETDDIYAYSCYFTSSANCTRFSSEDYGAYVPYERGRMVSAKRENGQDVVIKGLIVSADVVKLYYNQNTYDIKFICYDEQDDDQRKTFSVNIYTNTSANSLTSSVWGYVLPSNILGGGTTKAYSTCQNGTQRLYVIGLENNYSIDFYSLNTTEGAYYTFTIKDKYGQELQGVKISAYRFAVSKEAWVVVEQAITDYSGSGVLFLEPFTLYQITLELSGYLTLDFDFTPAGITSLEVALSGTSEEPLQLPDYYYLWDDVAYSLEPTNSTFNDTFNITYQVSSANSTLEYFGMEVFYEYNGTRTSVYSNNLTTSPSGGTINYTASENGTYIVNTWIKSQNQSLFSPLSSRYTFRQSNLGFLKAREIFNEGQPISGWGFYFIGVVATMLVVGFVSQYTIDGAGLAGLAVLWGFTLFNPDAILVCVGGLDGTCITPVISTTLTSVVVLAGVYIKQAYT